MCAAVYCLSWLSSPFSASSSLSPSLPSVLLSFIHLLFSLGTIGDLLSSGRRGSSFLLGARREVVSFESDGLSRGRERGRLFIPTDVEKVAIPRGEPPWSCKSYEQVIRGVTRGRTRVDGTEETIGWKGDVRLFSDNANRSPSI